jgi:hypothetical protein
VARFNDIVFRIPSVVPRHVAEQAAVVLKLSPPEYTENLANLGVTLTETSVEGLSAMSEEEYDNFVKELAVEFGSPTWKDAYEAKLQCSAVLRNIVAEQEKLKKEVLRLGGRNLPELITTSDPSKSNTLSIYNVYDLIWPDDSSSPGVGPSEGQDPRMQRLLAVHNLLLDNADSFEADSVNLLATQRFRVRNEKELYCLRTVRGWIREDKPQFTEFMDKVRNIQRKLPADRTKGLSPASNASEIRHIPVQGLSSWSESDLLIIEFLENFLVMRRRLQQNPFEAYSAVIAKILDNDATPDKGLYRTSGEVPSDLAARVAVIQLLKDIGVYRDWENLVCKDAELGLEAWSKQVASPDPKYTKDVRPTIDGLDSVRHDFGDLPVYVIDDATASELDDGISIQPSSKLDSRRRPTFWTHVHIADPTSILQPGDDLSRQAEITQASFYLPEMTLPMIPFEIIKAQGWSLGDLPEQRVMSFSFRLDEDGNVLEQTVRAGIVRNIKRCTYDTIDLAISEDDTTSSTTAAASNDQPSLVWPYRTYASQETSPSRKQLSLSDIEPQSLKDLKNLNMLSKKLMRRRIDGTALVWAATSRQSNIIVHSKPLLPDFSTPSTPGIATCVPHIELVLPSGKKETSYGLTPAQNLVAEFMIQAGRTAASHLSQRNISVPYRGQLVPFGSKQSIQEILALRDPETGAVSPAEMSKRHVLFQNAYFSTEPIGHWPMGITAESGGYVRATSPLRRFSDMVVHWQLKSTMVKDQKPRFSTQEVKQMIKQIDRTGRARTRSERRAKTFWKLFLIQQKLLEVRADPSSDPLAADLLLGGLTAVIGESKLNPQSASRLTSVFISELGVPATMTRPAGHASPAIGSKSIVDISGLVLDDFSKLFVKLRGEK